METQPTQQGMMQLFMSLGLSQNSSLTGLQLEKGSSEGPDSLAFANILEQYQSQGESPLTAMSALGSNAESTQLAQPDLLATAIQPSLAQEILPPLGNGLPLNPKHLPHLDSMAKTASLALKAIDVEGSSALMVERKEELTLSLDEQGENSQLSGQSFQAQSLVSSILPTNAQAINPAGASRPLANQAGLQGSNASMNRSASANPASALNKPTDSVMTSMADIEVEGTRDDLSFSTPADDVQKDRFLGAENSTTSASLKSGELNTGVIATSANQTPQAPAASQELVAALAQAEDPALESAQDIEALEEFEQAEVENRLSASERKQDEQTLKLTKGQQAWGDALSERITMNAAKDVKQVTIHLDPPELGSLELKLQVKEDQQTQVQVQVQNPQVKEALESSAQRLRDMLSNQGMELSEFDVQTGAQQGKGGDPESQNESENLSQQDSDALAAEGEEITMDISRPKNNNLLDTFV